MNYKEEIAELLEEASDRQIKCSYFFLKGMINGQKQKEEQQHGED